MKPKALNTFQKRRLICAASAIASAVFGIWQTILECIYFEPNNGVYSLSAPSRAPLYTAVTLFCILIFSCVFLGIPKEPNGTVRSISEKHEPLPIKIISLLCGVTLLAATAIRAYAVISNRSGMQLPSFVIALLLILPIPFFVYFVPSIFKGNEHKLPVQYYYCGMLGVIWLILNAIALYTDESLPVASDYRSFTEISILIFSLFLTSELRERIAASKPRQYLALVSSSAVCCGTVYIGRLVLCLSGKIALGNETALTLIGVSFTVYVFTRMYLIFSEPMPETGKNTSSADGIDNNDPSIKGDTEYNG